MLHLLLDILRNAILITGLVVIMMMIIESFNIESKGHFFEGLRNSKLAGVVVSALMGVIPGCMGGFAAVSMYTHGILSFGALIAMMIASSGDEAFVLLAMVPQKAVMIFTVLFVLAIVVGILVDLFYKPRRPENICDEGFSSSAAVNRAIKASAAQKREIGGEHNHSHHRATGDKKIHLSWQRVVMFVGVIVFLAALVSGYMEHEHAPEDAQAYAAVGATLLDEQWMNVLLACVSAVILVVLVRGSDVYVEENLWNHIVKKHLPSIFGWTFGVLVAVGILFHFVDVSKWISDNTWLMILLAAAVGFIPESGPHMIFITLYASGIIPLPVLLASCISQDGHASIPLLASNKRSFAVAKLLNFVVAILVGIAATII